MSRAPKKPLAKQSLASIGLNAHYWGESCSIMLLKLHDTKGNQLALPGNDYRKFVRHYQQQPAELPPEALISAMENADLRLVKYFSAENRAPFELQRITAAGEILTIDDKPLAKINKETGEPIQNCIVMTGNRLYVHPKTRSSSGIFSALRDALGLPCTPKDEKAKTSEPAIIGINHSSLSGGERVQFAGSLVFNEDHGWVLENTTGHYQTSAYQLIHTLKQLASNGFNIAQLTVKTWVANELGSRSADEADYHITYRNALELLETSERSKTHCDLLALPGSAVAAAPAAAAAAAAAEPDPDPDPSLLPKDEATSPSV
ncbi:MAG: hypothetical protein P1U63_08970 [Coxiellaceae bacterium]|nr:hypothetical protein [Coxiellaceae bacterium]